MDIVVNIEAVSIIHSIYIRTPGTQRDEEAGLSLYSTQVPGPGFKSISAQLQSFRQRKQFLPQLKRRLGIVVEGRDTMDIIWLPCCFFLLLIFVWLPSFFLLLISLRGWGVSCQ